MSDRTVTRADLADAIYGQVGLSRNESAELVELILEEMTQALVRDESLKISKFGTFSVREKAARTGRNPRTGVEAPIPPRRVIVFRASNVLKGRINGLDGAEDDF